MSASSPSTSPHSTKSVLHALRAVAAHVRASIARQERLPLGRRCRQIVRSLAAAITAPIFLRRCDSVGSFARTFAAQPRIDNRGHIRVGDRFAVNCAFVPVELHTSKGGSISVGDGVGINFGTVVSATGRIDIGHGVSIGPYCVVGAPDNDTEAARAPIEIGEGVWLAARVTVRPGVRIGAHAVVSAGAVVSGDLPPFAVASGAPARVLRIFAPEGVSPEGVSPEGGSEA